MRFFGQKTILLTIFCSSFACVGCSDVALDPPRQTVRAIWDPTTGALPTPTDLARDVQTGRLNLPINDQMSPAQQGFRRYMNTLDAYPINSTISLPLSGPIDLSTLPGSVVLVNEGSGRRLDARLQWDEARQRVVVEPTGRTPEDRLEVGASYTFGMWGYSGGAKDQAGQGIVADSAFYLVRSPEDVREHPWSVPGQTRQDRALNAQTLSEVQQSLEPMLQRVSEVGVLREEIAVVSSFSVTNEPFVWFDSATGQLPVPNDLVFDRETSRVALPAREDDSPTRAKLKALLNQYDGFATSAPLTIKVSAPVDPQSAADPQAIRLFHVPASGPVKEVTALERGVLDDGVTIWIKPIVPLVHNAEYVYTVRRDLLTSQGSPIAPQPIGALLRLRDPLLEQGVSTVDVISDAQASLLEPRRLKTQAVLTHLKQQGIAPEQLSAAVPFKTTSSVEHLLAHRTMLYERGPSTEVVNTTSTTPSRRGLGLVLPDVETVISGKMFVRDHLDAVTQGWREDGQGEDRLVDFVLTIPEGAKPGQDVPVVVFGHGLVTSRELMYMIANTLAKAGFAAISMDLPLHGERTVCTQDTDCVRPATCGVQRACLLSDGTKGELVRVEGPWSNSPSYPVASGWSFLDLHHIDATRDRFTQATIDLMQLVRVTRAVDWATITGGVGLKDDDVVYLGMSLGGILGSILTVVEPTIGTYVLNVPGGDFLAMVQNSSSFKSVFAQELDDRGIEPGTDEHFEFLSAARWLLDPIDPINIAHHAILDPISYREPVTGEIKQAPIKRVMIQMAEGDSVVPNISTRILSERMQVPHITYSPSISNHAFLFDPTSGEGRRARQDMVRFFEQRQ